MDLGEMEVSNRQSGPGSSRRAVSAGSLGTACAPALTNAVEGTLSVVLCLYVELQSHLLPLPPLRVFVADKTGPLSNLHKAKSSPVLLRIELDLWWSQQLFDAHPDWLQWVQWFAVLVQGYPWGATS